jgi:putative component of membrane protein insertase Oxa1/YidC/SpoIIIJ protein YidD
MLRMTTALGIKFYQRFLSKRKGFKCAHGVLHQDGTCSSIILNIVKENPINKWKKLILSQFNSCKLAKITIDDNKKKKKKKGNNVEKFCEGLDNCTDCADCADIGSC